MLIEIEGIDGAGKTTQCQLLKSWLNDNGKDVVLLKEPASTEFGIKLKELLISDVARHHLAEMFTFLAGKAQMYAEVINTSVSLGKVVILDRGSGSFLSYHHIKTGLQMDVLRSLLGMVTFGVPVALTILLDLPVEMAIERKRKQQQLTKFDGMGAAFFQRQRDVFLSLSEETLNWNTVDSSRSIEEVAAEINKLASLFWEVR